MQRRVDAVIDFDSLVNFSSIYDICLQIGFDYEDHVINAFHEKYPEFSKKTIQKFNNIIKTVRKHDNRGH